MAKKVSKRRERNIDIWQPKEYKGPDASYQYAYATYMTRYDLDSAVLDFKQHLADYPNSEYIPHVHFWLGEIYYVQNRNALAKQSLSLFIKKLPRDAKARVARTYLKKLRKY